MKARVLISATTGAFMGSATVIWSKYFIADLRNVWPHFATYGDVEWFLSSVGAFFYILSFVAIWAPGILILRKQLRG